MKTFKFLLTLMFALVFNTIVAASVSVAAPVDFLTAAIVLNLVSLVPMQLTGVFAAKLTKEIWLPDLMEKFYPEGSFLNDADDWSAWVENDKINFAEIGAEPNVLLNNASYPIAIADRNDTPLSVELEEYQTEGTVLHNAELVELAYDKRTSVVKQHKQVLYNKFAVRAAFNYAPTTDAQFTPVIPTAGAANGLVKRLKFEDVLLLKSRFDNIEAPENRILVLNPDHFNDLALEDLSYLRSVLASGNTLFGFKLRTFSKTPLYNAGTKADYGDQAPGAGETSSSIAFVGSEIMRALSSFDMFELLRSPEYAGDVINFRMRGLAMPKRNKYVGAIYTDLV